MVFSHVYNWLSLLVLSGVAYDNSRLSSLHAARDVSPGGKSAPQRQKFHDDVNQCLHTKSGSHGILNLKSSILCFSWSIMVKFCVPRRTSSNNTQMLLLKKNIFHEDWLFCTRVIAFSFHFCDCLLSVVRKQLLKQLNQYVDQSELLTRFWRKSKSSVWNFCRWGADVPSSETSRLAARKEERPLFSQAKSKAPPHCAFNPWSYTLEYRKGTTGEVTLSGSDYPVVSDSWQYFSWAKFSRIGLSVAFCLWNGYWFETSKKNHLPRIFRSQQLFGKFH